MRRFVAKALEQIASSAETGIWDAHRGCALIAGALLVDDGLIDDEAKALARRLLDGISGAFPKVSRKASAGSTLLSREHFLANLVSELAPNARSPKEIGHDIIYSAYVMKALDRFDITPWESLRDQVMLLIRKIKASGPGWITINGEK